MYNTDTITINPVHGADAGEYTCTVTDTNCCTFQDSGMLIVTNCCGDTPFNPSSDCCVDGVKYSDGSILFGPVWSKDPQMDGGHVEVNETILASGSTVHVVEDRDVYASHCPFSFTVLSYPDSDTKTWIDCQKGNPTPESEEMAAGPVNLVFDGSGMTGSGQLDLGNPKAYSYTANWVDQDTPHRAKDSNVPYNFTIIVDKRGLYDLNPA